MRGAPVICPDEYGSRKKEQQAESGNELVTEASQEDDGVECPVDTDEPEEPDPPRAHEGEEHAAKEDAGPSCKRLRLNVHHGEKNR